MPEDKPIEKKKFIPWSPYKTVEQFVNRTSYVIGDEASAKFCEERQRFIDLLMEPDFHVMSFAERAEALGVQEKTVRIWWKQCPYEYMAQALKVSREKHAGRTLEVDAALYREATEKGGDAKHKELYYRRIENWEPKQGLELSKGKDKELTPDQMAQALKDALQLLPEDKRAELLREAQQGPVLEAKSEPEGVEGKNVE